MNERESDKNALLLRLANTLAAAETKWLPTGKVVQIVIDEARCVEYIDALRAQPSHEAAPDPRLAMIEDERRYTMQGPRHAGATAVSSTVTPAPSGLAEKLRSNAMYLEQCFGDGFTPQEIAAVTKTMREAAAVLSATRLSERRSPQDIIGNIVADICSRKGLRHEWDAIDDSIRDEIVAEWLTFFTTDNAAPGANKGCSTGSPVACTNNGAAPNAGPVPNGNMEPSERTRADSHAGPAPGWRVLPSITGTCKAYSVQMKIDSNGGWYCYGCGASNLEPGCKYNKSATSDGSAEGKP